MVDLVILLTGFTEILSFNMRNKTQMFVIINASTICLKEVWCSHKKIYSNSTPGATQILLLHKLMKYKT